jgi:hypothetical protein
VVAGSGYSRVSTFEDNKSWNSPSEAFISTHSNPIVKQADLFIAIIAI